VSLPERDLWTIVTCRGEVRSFRTRADVATAVYSGVVQRGDRLLGGDAPSTPVEQVPELAGYFASSALVENTVPYGLDVPELENPDWVCEVASPSARDSEPLSHQPNTLAQALLELAGEPPPSARPSVFEFGVHEPRMAPRRASDRAPAE
jgi:hypothetical protein